MVWGENIEQFKGTLFLRDIYRPGPFKEEDQETVEALAEELEDMDLEKVPKLKVWPYATGLYQLLPSELILFQALVLLRRSYFRVEVVEAPLLKEVKVEKGLKYNQLIQERFVVNVRDNRLFDPPRREEE